MLVFLRINNFALIDDLEIEFQQGLNVLTGETGAGKSIILDAIDVVLGGKINHRMVRGGEERAIIEVSFQIDHQLSKWLAEQDIDLIEDQTLICSREIAIVGQNLRSRSRVNGIVVNRKLMDELREKLVEITAQGQTILLTIPSKQRELLDLYGGEEITHQKVKVSKIYQQTEEALTVLNKRKENEQQRLQKLDLLQYQYQELQRANLTNAEELLELEIERQRLSHVVDLQAQSYQVYQLLYQNDRDGLAATDLLAKAQTSLQEMVNIDQGLQPILDLVNNAISQIDEAAREINYYGDTQEADPERLLEIEERIRELKLICRKYGPTLTDVLNFYETVERSLLELTEQEESLESLEQTYHNYTNQLIIDCKELRRLRQIAAIKLENQLIDELKPLAMEKVQFKVKFSHQLPTTEGADRIEFELSTNPGEELQPLALTASGGEMSRFLLALKACFSQINNINTLIFDEIDVGVSGKVAQAIAEKLYQLSVGHQLLCVTHQPLVAVMADHHWRVNKKSINQNNAEIYCHTANSQLIEQERTIIQVIKLEKDAEKQAEIAQLAGGKSAEEAYDFAQSLLKAAKKIKGINNVKS